jgi:hypothetical protein
MSLFCSLKRAVSGVVIGGAAMATVLPANAIVVSGRWDPLYGSPFLAGVGGTSNDMDWSGEALFNIPDTAACAANAGNGFLVQCAGMFVSDARVFLSDGATVVDTLAFSGTLSLSKVQFNADGSVRWVESGWWNPLAAGSASEYNLSNFLFSLSFEQDGANLFHTASDAYLEKHGGHGPDDKVYFWEGQGKGHIGDLCSPTTAPFDGDRCGFSNTMATVVFAPIPEPSTYALMLAGLAAVGFMARRRRGV